MSYKKIIAKQAKELEEYYMDLDTFRAEEKKYRVKVRQLENELELNLKRLDIICKTKGLPRASRPKVGNY